MFFPGVFKVKECKSAAKTAEKQYFCWENEEKPNLVPNVDLKLPIANATLQTSFAKVLYWFSIDRFGNYFSLGPWKNCDPSFICFINKNNVLLKTYISTVSQMFTCTETIQHFLTSQEDKPLHSHIPHCLTKLLYPAPQSCSCFVF